jgi:hypothetical protein
MTQLVDFIRLYCFLRKHYSRHHSVKRARQIVWNKT